MNRALPREMTPIVTKEKRQDWGDDQGGTWVGRLWGTTVGGQVPVFGRVPGLVEDSVVIVAQFLQLFIVDQLTKGDEAVTTKGICLFVGEGAVRFVL